ncbi:MAG: MCP four helix bundle domain-containing protein [Lewinellaceae bacterium]|nr:MCP four helix bundle domain-containing protein [Lewinellaceae bacterium]
MKWTYSIKGKIKAALLLAIILGITILTNMLERRRFQELERSFSSIYEDRLMAESYLFHLYENLKEKQDLLQFVAEKGINQNIRTQLKEYRKGREKLIEKYAQTYLTEEEEIQFNNLDSLFAWMARLEEDIIRQSDAADIPANLFQKHESVTTEAFSTLSALSDIQTIEGKALREKSKRIIMGSVSMSHFEMTILIIIGIIIQGLIFSSRTLLTGDHQSPSMN